MLVETGARMSVAGSGSKPASAVASDSGELDSSMTMSTDTSSTGRSEDCDMSLNSSLNDDHASLTSSYRTLQVRTTVDISETITSTDSSGSKVTLYKIDVQSNDICFHFPSSCVWRSYSDFIWLRKRLASSCSLTKRGIPDLPSRNLLSLFDRDFEVRRKEGLQEFLRKVVKDRSFLSDAALHLFLQSNLSVEKIQSWLDNKMDDSVFDLIQRGKNLVLQDDSTSQIEEDEVSQTEQDEVSQTEANGPSNIEDV